MESTASEWHSSKWRTCCGKQIGDVSCIRSKQALMVFNDVLERRREMSFTRVTDMSRVTSDGACANGDISRIGECDRFSHRKFLSLISSSTCNIAVYERSMDSSNGAAETHSGTSRRRFHPCRERDLNCLKGFGAARSTFIGGEGSLGGGTTIRDSSNWKLSPILETGPADLQCFTTGSKDISRLQVQAKFITSVHETRTSIIIVSRASGKSSSWDGDLVAFEPDSWTPFATSGGLGVIPPATITYGETTTTTTTTSGRYATSRVNGTDEDPLAAGEQRGRGLADGRRQSAASRWGSCSDRSAQCTERLIQRAGRHSAASINETGDAAVSVATPVAVRLLSKAEPQPGSQCHDRLRRPVAFAHRETRLAWRAYL